MIFLFWFFIAIVFYTYFGYPIVLIYCAWVKQLLKKNEQTTLQDSTLPLITVVIAAYNEEKHITKKIQDTLNLSYPKEKRDILVFSDASSDRTDEIVRSFEKEGVRLLRIEGRKGKTYCQNKAVEEAKGDIIVFTDATSILQENSLLKIVQPFKDTQVGCVGGALQYAPHYGATDNIGENEGMYGKFEHFIKKKESECLSVIGVSGAFYAVRKEAYVSLPDYVISDLIEPLIVRKYGYKSVYQPSAVCVDYTASSHGNEFHRKIRTILRGMNGLFWAKQLMNPLRHPIVSWQIFSHKTLRWSAPYILLILFFVHAGIVLVGGGTLYTVLFYFHIGIYIGAVVGCKSSLRIFRVMYYVMMLNVAAFIASIQFLRGKNMIVWETK